MNKVIRIAIAAAFGVAATVPALADFESYGPGTKQNQELSSLSEVNPPSLDSDPRNALGNTDRRTFRSDRIMLSDNRVTPERRDYYSANGRYLGSDLRFYTPDGRYVSPDGRYVSSDGRYMSSDGRYLRGDDQFGYAPVLAQNHRRLNGGIWPGQTLE